MKRALVLILWLVLIVGSTNAQDNYRMSANDGAQIFRGTINDAENDDILVYIADVEAGDTLYATADGTEDVDPYLVLSDEDLSEGLAEDDDSGGDLSSALVYTFSEAGTYVLGMFSINGGGDYTITAGVNTPDVLTGMESIVPDAPSVDNNAIDTALIVRERGIIQEFTGVFQNVDDEIIVRVEDVRVGDTINVYAAGLGSVDTYVYVLDETTDEIFAEDDDGGGGYNSAISYEARESGTYNIGLITIGGVGNYTLYVGINTPELMERADQATSNTTNLGSFNCNNVESGDRPRLSGTERTVDGGSFVIHYTLSGRDETTQEWVDEMVEALDRSLDVQINDLGWALPPSDCGEGGDSRLDVYVVDMSDESAIGYASPENVVGDNPNTDVEEFYAAYSYLAIENDMEFVPRRRGLELMRTTAAHEVHHNIQFGYDVNDRFYAFYEAGASWIETLVYPTQTNSYEYVTDLFSSPDRCMGYMDDDSLRIYAEWVMIDSFTRDLGIESYQFIWEYLAAGEGLNGFYNALRELDTTPQSIIERMAVRNLLLNYALAKRFDATVRIETTIDGTGTVTPRRNGVQELGVDYVRISDQGLYTFELIDSEEMAMFLVGVDTGEGVATVYDLGQMGTVDTRAYDFAYMIILNTDQHTNVDLCDYASWTIRVSDGSGDGLTAPDDEVWDASQFIEP